MSVFNFTFASVNWPDECEMLEKYVNVTLVSTSAGAVSLITVETLNWSPKVLCKKPDEDRSAHYEIEYFCIMVVTVEFLLRFV